MSTPVFHHVHVLCRDLEAMIAFWTEGLGGKVIKRRDFFGDPGAELDIGSGTVLLYLRQVKADGHETDLKSPLPYNHVGLRVDNVDKALEKALTLPGTSVHTPAKDAGDLRIAFVYGPENVLVELIAAKA
ncbi:MAG: VOC family protein [Methylobacteriaceae bacterium]|jgi:catechol 2,3-dioxygenase-like lactoylglutathione lyase family enzyme|nr:VOC family protein [Methylobacteriaceae bacterium]